MTRWTFEERRTRAPVSWRVYVPGLALIGLALLVLVAPEILAALVAAVLFTAGLAASVFAWKLRHAERYTIEARPIEPMVDPIFELFRRT